MQEHEDNWDALECVAVADRKRKRWRLASTKLAMMPRAKVGGARTRSNSMFLFFKRRTLLETSPDSFFKDLWRRELRFLDEYLEASHELERLRAKRAGEQVSLSPGC